MAEQIGENNKTKDADMIFLSEINTQKNELKEVFLKEINTKEKDNEKYDILYPIATDETLGRASCTICLKKNGLKNYTNEGNGFNIDEDYLHFCKIVSRNDKEVIVLIGIHWAVGYDEYVLRTAEFILSLKRLLTFTLGQKIKVILFGDTNSNPDVNLEKAVKEKKTARIEAYLNNSIFEQLMNELGLHEIIPEGKPYTYEKGTRTDRVETRVDRVFTNMPKDKVKAEVVSEFLEKELSDHAALVITYEEG